ncbi:hypothetical protein [Nitrosopumilus ureiphilus]|uniref:Uncharacterized protein n=1 Tax=Nitrosopumilus ureiphilus TaxID=1470067 RepID=A0A7D5M6G2_9ARCH|nr:hypothetical protein [Nitrosopumilus ureiphilus]QLH06087.1 hypothetical protein C5F50_02585 [Nitrosopumilus ureiphilus]
MKIFVLSVVILLAFEVIIEAEAYGNYRSQSEYEYLLVESDKESYMIGDVINITGTVEKYHENESIQIILYSPTGRIASLLKTDVSPEKNFSIFIDTVNFEKIGVYNVKSNFGRYSEVTEISFTINPYEKSNPNQNIGDDTNAFTTRSESQELIPQWFHNISKWWSLSQISNSDFVEGIKYLIKHEIINFPKDVSLESKESPRDLAEIRKNVRWWSQGILSDTEFLKSIQYLLHVEAPEDPATLFLTPKSYRFGQPVTVTLVDPDLNLNSDLIDIYRVVDDPNSPFVDTVGSSSGGILLEIRIKDIRYQRCTINDVEHGGLASTGFVLIETGTSTGIFEGIFKVPTKICNKLGNELISSAGGSISLRYHDFRDSFGQPNIQQTQ